LRAMLRSIDILGRLVVGAALLGAPRSLVAQVGLTSGLARVAVVAHVAPKGSIQGVGVATETGRSGNLGEFSVALSLTANTSYKLVVRKVGASASRIWVRSAAGNFEELRAGLPVVVAQDSDCAGEKQVQYRTEGGEVVDLASIVYDLVLAPTL
jgi:hypothetical protein